MEDPSKHRAMQEPGGGEARAKKEYHSPQLVDWGSITDLTQGILAGSKDFPLKGGTRPV